MQFKFIGVASTVGGLRKALPQGDKKYVFPRLFYSVLSSNKFIIGNYDQHGGRGIARIMKGTGPEMDFLPFR